MDTQMNDKMQSDVFVDALFEEEPPVFQAEQFKIFGLSSLLYAVVYTVCMFQNSNGITMPVWIAATIMYACTMMKKLSVTTCGHLRKGSGFCITVMLLIGVSTVFTDASYMVLLNYIGFFLMLMMFLLYNFCDDSQWDFSKSIAEMILAVFGGIGCMIVPFTDGYAFWHMKKIKQNKTLKAVLIGCILAVPGMLVLGICLSIADAVFEAMVMRLFSGLHVPATVMRVIAMLLFGYFSSYCGMRYLLRRSRMTVKAHQTAFDPVIAMTFSGVIVVMYLVFCGVQVLYLFAGNMRLPKGMTYAAYAQRGFYMLLFVCFVNLALVLCIRRFFARHKILDVMLLLICACTYLMLASSAYRMYLYIGAYQLTVLRVFVVAALVALAFLLAGVALLICRPRFPLFHYGIAVVSVVYICLAFLNVDCLVAGYNLSHARQTEHLDLAYLASLSPDAAPAMADYYEQASEEVRENIRNDVTRIKMVLEGQGDGSARSSEYWFAQYLSQLYYKERNMGLRNFNVSRYRAVRLFRNLSENLFDITDTISYN